MDIIKWENAMTAVRKKSDILELNQAKLGSVGQIYTELLVKL